MKIAHECLASVKEDIKPLIEKHWEMVALNQGKILLNPLYCLNTGRALQVIIC